jgi:hypothetical protein
MPYQADDRLPAERASKLGHLEVIKSPLVKKLLEAFSTSSYVPQTANSNKWISFKSDASPLNLIFAVDGSLQVIKSDASPHKELAFIKTALLRIDNSAIADLDQKCPHPHALRDIMSDSALYHATVLPLKNISIPGQSNYNAIREIIFESFADDNLNRQPLETLKWLAYQKWQSKKLPSPSFECPHCMNMCKGISYDSEAAKCESCNGDIYITDMLGFHLDMADESAPQSIASAYMLMHETLLLFSGIRHFWEQNKFEVLKRTLFMKDGPLALRSQYVKLIDPIRNFLIYAKSKNVPVHIVGQEKTGAFVDHLEMIAPDAPAMSYFLLTNDYIRREIQQRPDRGELYGFRTNYGNKLFFKTSNYHYVALSIPTGEYKDTSSALDFIGLENILSSICKLVSHKHHSALIPIQLANGIASLSTYPSARILKIFAEI